jgi:hypothetical protein
MSKATRNIIILAIGLILASSTLFGFMVYKVAAEGSLLTKQIDALKKETGQEASYNKLQKIAVESLEERELLRSYFIDSNGNGIDLLNSVEALAPQVGVSLTTESVTLITETDDGSEWIQATFAFSADRRKVQDFIKIIETLPHVLRINSVLLESRASSVWEAEVTVQVRVLDYDK